MAAPYRRASRRRRSLPATAGGGVGVAGRAKRATTNDADTVEILHLFDPRGDQAVGPHRAVGAVVTRGN